MALNNRSYDIGALAEFTQNGFTAALYPQIRDSLARAMKEIYGYDIDLSSASADGQYINMEALILNNIYRVLESINANTIPSSATGSHLDILASYSGAIRVQPSYSTAQLWVANTSNQAETPDSLTFMDKDGNIWLWINPLDIDSTPLVSFPPMTGANYNPISITATCTTLGAVTAFATGAVDMGNQTAVNIVFNQDALERGGSIYQTVESSVFSVYQNVSATVGNERESDSSLRERRVRSFGEAGTTVLNSLVANLLNEEGIVDVFVFNNNTVADKPMDDGVTVASHDVYVCVYLQNQPAEEDETPAAAGTTPSVPDSTIGNIIYDQLTPGVLTTDSSDSDEQTYFCGETRSLQIALTRGDVSPFSTTIYWKNCLPQTPALRIVCKFNGSEFTSEANYSDEQKDAIANSIVTYLNNIKIGQPVQAFELLSVVSSSDFKSLPYGYATYIPFRCDYVSEVNGNTETYLPFDSKTLPLSRFKYSTADVTFTDSAVSSPDYFYITIGNGVFPEPSQNT